jgi:Common central domain of tyrosinase
LSPQGVSAPTSAPIALRHRRNARRLTTGQLADFRNAISQAQAISDDRGYQYWSGIHGLPLPIYCTHNSPLFLAWHRAYLYLLEKALQDRVPGVTLPWWDWSTHHQQGLPGPYRAEQANGQPNPLYDSPIQARGRRDPSEDRTWRQTGQDGALASRAQVRNVLANRDFMTFQSQLWAAWTHRVSAIPGWLLPTVIVAAAVFFFLLAVLLPTIASGFLQPLPIGLLAAAVVAAATAQWFPAVALAIGAALARAVRNAALAVGAHLRDKAPTTPP